MGPDGAVLQLHPRAEHPRPEPIHGLLGQAPFKLGDFANWAILLLYAAIVGLPDARLGERNCLCLVPRPGDPPTLEELLAFLGDSVATYKLPERLLLILDTDRAVDLRSGRGMEK